MIVWDPYMPRAVILWRRSSEPLIRWKGQRSVHQMFQPSHIDYFRKQHPDVKVIVHPLNATKMWVNNKAPISWDRPEYIIRTITAARQNHLGSRNRTQPGQPPKHEQTDKKIVFPVVHGVPMRHDVHRRPAPLLGAGESGRRTW